MSLCLGMQNVEIVSSSKIRNVRRHFISLCVESEFIDMHWGALRAKWEIECHFRGSILGEIMQISIDAAMLCLWRGHQWQVRMTVIWWSMHRVVVVAVLQWSLKIHNGTWWHSGVKDNIPSWFPEPIFGSHWCQRKIDICSLLIVRSSQRNAGRRNIFMLKSLMAIFRSKFCICGTSIVTKTWVVKQYLNVSHWGKIRRRILRSSFG